MINRLNIKTIFVLLIVIFGFSSIVAYGASYMYDSKDISYDNTASGIESTNVQDAIDELYSCASDYGYAKDLTTDNASIRNSIFRGEDVTKYYDDGTLWTRISSGEFTDLYVGDYIYKNNTYWRIAGFDIYLGKGNSTNTSINQTYSTHHAVIVPDYGLTTAQMNETNTTGDVGYTYIDMDDNTEKAALGYVGSKMYNVTLPSVLSTYIEPVFGTHVLQYRNVLTVGMTSSRYNRYGTNSGASIDWNWETRKLDLMNENQVYGGIVWSSSGYETGSDNIQFPLFALKPEYIVAKNASGNSQTYWLRNVTSSSNFAFIYNRGYSGGNYGASNSYGVRPYFYID